MFVIPLTRRRDMSFKTVSRLCSLPTAAASASTNDCTPRLTRFTPHRAKVPTMAAFSVPGAHSTVISAQIQRVQFALEASAQLAGGIGSVFDVRADTCDIPLKQGAGKDIRSKVA